jgi:hypothetical protein
MNIILLSVSIFKGSFEKVYKKVPLKDILEQDAIAANIMSVLLFRYFKYFRHCS